ncbi:hypothetical protein [Pseudolysinimonas sp.]|jgi:hypothetical protein|uniref:hypothetical protein n=1 Tax=Pseudolysinimonas sp. TaxID=2680009 RepID=UPI00378424EB
MTGTRIWTFGAVLVIAGILALGWLLGISPLLSSTAAADAERASVEAQNLTQRAQLAVMKADFENLDVIAEELAPLELSIPGDERTEVFAATVESFAAANQVALTSYVASELPFFGVPVDGATASTSGTGGIALSTPAGTVYAIPITIGFEGTPEAVLNTVRALQSGQRLFLVNTVAFDRGLRGSPSATVTGYIFMLTDRQLAPTPEDAAAAAPENTSSYEVPDLNEALPEWLGGEGTAPSTVTGATPTPTPTGTPVP